MLSEHQSGLQAGQQGQLADHRAGSSGSLTTILDLSVLAKGEGEQEVFFPATVLIWHYLDLRCMQ